VADNSAAAPTVSVLMTAYNRASYIGAAVKSVLNQTFSDLELIVVDDSSTDDTVGVVRSLAASDDRVRIVCNPQTLGDYANRNHAASFARGHLLKYHDSDDVMYPHCLATMVPPLIAERRAAFSLSLGQAWSGGPCPIVSTPRMSFQREFLGFGLFHGGPSCGLFRKDVLRALGGFEDYGPASDHVFWLRACARHTVLLLPADLFWYRIHGGQEIHSDRASRAYALVPRFAWQALNAVDCPLEGPELVQAKKNHVFGTAKGVWRQLRAGNWFNAARRFQCAGLSLTDWARYLRRARRSALAGTPLTSDGEYFIPEWPARPFVEGRHR
jgi:glycosyltransferase involved in cell wall biosynthesis